MKDGTYGTVLKNVARVEDKLISYPDTFSLLEFCRGSIVFSQKGEECWLNHRIILL